MGLDRLFNNSIFRIPDYQRSYSWGDSQLMDFWDNLINLQNGHYHYTVMLSLKELPKKEWESWIDDNWIIEKKGFTPYHVIDGQQRITTCVILINEIICLAEQNNIEEINPSETSETKK